MFKEIAPIKMLTYGGLYSIFTDTENTREDLQSRGAHLLRELGAPTFFRKRTTSSYTNEALIFSNAFWTDLATVLLHFYINLNNTSVKYAFVHEHINDSLAIEEVDFLTLLDYLVDYLVEENLLDIADIVNISDILHIKGKTSALVRMAKIFIIIYNSIEIINVGQLKSSITDKISKRYKVSLTKTDPLYSVPILHMYLQDIGANVTAYNIFEYAQEIGFSSSKRNYNTYGYNTYSYSNSYNSYYSQYNNKVDTYTPTYNYLEDSNKFLDNTSQLPYTFIINNEGSPIILNNLLNLVRFDTSSCNCLKSDSLLKEDIESKRAEILQLRGMEVNVHNMQEILKKVTSSNELYFSEPSILETDPELSSLITSLLESEQNQLDLLKKLIAAKQDFSNTLSEMLLKLSYYTLVEIEEELEGEEGSYEDTTIDDEDFIMETAEGKIHFFIDEEVPTPTVKQAKEKKKDETTKIINNAAKDIAEAVVTSLINKNYSIDKILNILGEWDKRSL